MDDKQLKELLMYNPQEGLSVAIGLYGGSVKWIAQKMIGKDRPQDVEECVSDAFVKLWQNIGRYELGRGIPLKSYLFGIARNTALDYNRKSRKDVEVDALEDNDIKVDVDFESEVAKGINAKIVQEAIDGLPAPDKEIFILRYFFGEKVLSIAEKLGLSGKTIENKLYRGKKVLKDKLIERGVIL